MGRERQKKKNKSSFPKVKLKPKSKKLDIKGSHLVAANWDKSLTLAQNYRRFGLTSRLRARAGGVQKTASQERNSNPASTGADNSLVVPSGVAAASAEARVVRDPKTGAILSVVPPQPDLQNPLNDPLNELSEDEDEVVASKTPTRRVVKGLEEEASREPRKRSHPASLWEREWVTKLIARHGNDYARMTRDRKLNPYQRTEADIRKRVTRWEARLAHVADEE